LVYGFRNVSSTPCSLFGYPGLQMLDVSNHPLPTTVQRGGSSTFPSTSPQTVVLQPASSAGFYLSYEDVPVGSETSCPTSATLEITPPNDFHPLVISDQIAPCSGGLISVSPVHPGTALPG